MAEGPTRSRVTEASAVARAEAAVAVTEPAKSMTETAVAQAPAVADAFTLVKERMPASENPAERVEPARHTAGGPVSFVHVVLGVVAVWDRRCIVRAARVEVVGVHDAWNCVLQDQSIRPSRAHQSQTQPEDGR
jgi:hypothetical protein